MLRQRIVRDDILKETDEGRAQAMSKMRPRRSVGRKEARKLFGVDRMALKLRNCPIGVCNGRWCTRRWMLGWGGMGAWVDGCKGGWLHGCMGGDVVGRLQMERLLIFGSCICRTSPREQVWRQNDKNNEQDRTTVSDWHRIILKES